MARTAVAVAGALVLLAACSGSDDAADTTEPATSPPTTEAPPPDTTAVPTTTEATTTTTTSTTSTSDVPTTTIDEEAALIAEVEQAYFDAFDAYHQAIFDPANEELREGLSEHRTGDALENVIGILDDLVELRAVARENPDFGPARTEIIGPVRFENDARTEATLVACQLNAEWFVEPESGPNGEDSVMRTDVIRVDLIMVLELGEDGRWRVSGGGNSVELIGETTCDER